MLKLKRYFRSVTPVEKITGYKFLDQQLLKTALTHRSSAINGQQSYERLEFLGDAVLEMVISETLFQHYCDKREGELTVMRATVVNREALAEVGLKLNLAPHILTDKSLNLANHATKRTLVGSTVEALIGAIYLDGGLKPAQAFIARWIMAPTDKKQVQSNINFKGRLLEVCQKHGWSLEYKMLQTTGPEHAKTYKIAVIVRGKVLGTGVGQKKRNAEQEAARQALKQLPAA